MECPNCHFPHRSENPKVPCVSCGAKAEDKVVPAHKEPEVEAHPRGFLDKVKELLGG
jgi:hypothetical protein